ncbi:MAG TPA: response regulator [Candidatus Limnocylindria bacterium]|nr:response regulator [Candidatus Limnocylindria bacterium]
MTGAKLADKIRVVIVDDIPETREHLTRLLGFEADVEVVGAAGSGPEALEVAGKLQPDILLLDINMPGMDGITAAELLVSRAPTAAIIMMSVQGEPDYLRRAMLAGAREFLVKPFSSDELAASIRQVHARERQKQGRIGASGGGERAGEPARREPGRVVTVFAPKGGVGRTTLAVNMAVAAATELGQSVVLVDGSLQFGDVGVLLNLSPKNKTITDLSQELTGDDDVEALDGALVSHSSGIRVLLAPPSPEMSEFVTVEHIQRIISALRRHYDLVIIDSWAWLQDSTLTFLDQADTVLLVLTLEISNIKNIRQFVELGEQLGYSESKVQLVLNRADAAYGIRVQDVESSIGRKINHTVVSDGRTVVYALNRGVPFVVSARQARVSEDVLRLTRAVAGPEAQAAETAGDRSAPKKGIFAWR